MPDPEIWEDCRGQYWAPWVQLFLPLINNQHGYWVHYLFEGALMDQPSTSMRILGTIQEQYFQYLREANAIPG